MVQLCLTHLVFPKVLSMAYKGVSLVEDGVVLRVGPQCDLQTRLTICQFITRVGGALPTPPLGLVVWQYVREYSVV